MGHMILIRQLRVESANAISSPMTYGFPSITAFMGFTHQLQRLVNRVAGMEDWRVDATAVVCHQFDVLDQPVGYGRRKFRLTGNPLTQQGSRPPFIEEGRCHLQVSLCLQCRGELAGGDVLWVETIRNVIMGRMRLAGGTIVNDTPIDVSIVQDDRRTLRRMMPGYALIERRDLMMTHMREEPDALAAWHRALALEFRSNQSDSGKVTWAGKRSQTRIHRANRNRLSSHLADGAQQQRPRPNHAPPDGGIRPDVGRIHPAHQCRMSIEIDVAISP